MPTFNTRNEEGFTLIELLVVILIIGVLAAVAIPAFMNQRKEATLASLKSDMKNAATIMTTEATKNKGRYPSAIPNYNGFSEGNLISVLPGSSNSDEFCLMGFNESNNQVLHYSSNAGTFANEQEGCTETANAPSYSLANSTKNVVMVARPEATASKAYISKNLTELGYVEDNILHISTGNLQDSHLVDAELLILVNQWWGSTPLDLQAATRFYEAGGDVFAEGNDTIPAHFYQAGTSTSGASPGFNPTYNSMSPAFPYTFNNQSFGSDGGWHCITELRNGGVPIATDTLGGRECISMFAAKNSSGGQFVYLIYANTSLKRTEFSQSYAALTWLMN